VIDFFSKNTFLLGHPLVRPKTTFPGRWVGGWLGGWGKMKIQLSQPPGAELGKYQEYKEKCPEIQEKFQESCQSNF
jgi:hypothetical protein